MLKSGKSRFLPETSGFCPLTTVWMFRGKTRHLYTLCVLSKIDTPYPLVKYTNCGYIYSSQIRFLMLSMDSAKSGSAIIDLIDGDMSPLPFTPTLQLDGPIEAIAIPPPIQASVLSVIRESLSNIARHAQATAATVKVVIGEDELRVVVEDNGIGISPDDALGNGRRNIGARATQFGGRAEIRNGESGVGTVVDWRVPLPARV